MEDGAEVSDLASSTGREEGWQLQWWQPEKEGGRRGHKVEVEELIWSGCNRIGSHRGWAVVGRVEGRRRKV